MLSGQSQSTINLEAATVLLLERSQHGLDVLMQMLLGFGVRNCQKSTTLEDAVAIAKRQTLDLVVVEPALHDADGLEFVRWLRRCGGDPNCAIPIFVTSADGSRASVERARDAGSSYFIVKPLTPSLLLDRVMRVARDGRSFVVCDSYAGPDRRFKHEGPPPGIAPRRSTDVDAQLGGAVEPNLSQDEIDSFVKPQKVTL